MNTKINKLFKKISTEGLKREGIGLVSEEEEWVVWVIVGELILATLASIVGLFLEYTGRSQIVGGIVLCTLVGLALLEFKMINWYVHLLNTANVYSSVAFCGLTDAFGASATLLWLSSSYILLLRLIKQRIECNKNSKLNKKWLFPSIGSCFIASFMGMLFEMSFASKLISFLNIQAILLLTNELRSVAIISRTYTDTMAEFFSGIVKGVSEGIFMTCKGKLIYQNDFFEKFTKNDHIDWSEKKTIKEEKVVKPGKNRNVSTHSVVSALQPIKEEESASSQRVPNRTDSGISNDSAIFEHKFARKKASKMSLPEEKSTQSVFEIRIRENDVRVNSLPNMDIFLSVKYEREDLISNIFETEPEGLSIAAFLERVDVMVEEANVTFGPIIVYVHQEEDCNDSETVSSGDENESIIAKRFFQIRILSYDTEFKRIIFTEIYIDDKKNPNIRQCTELAQSESHSRIGNSLGAVNKQISSLSLNYKRSDFFEQNTQLELFANNESSNFSSEHKSKTASMLHDFKNIAIEFSNISESILSGKIEKEEGIRLALFVREYMLGLILHMTEYQKAGRFFNFIPGRELTEVSIKKVLVEMVAIFKTRQLLDADKSNVEISFEDKIENEITFSSDETLVVSLFYNIISNSYKYTDEGFIKVNFFEENDNLCVSVSDTGGGIPEEVLEKWGTAFNNIDPKKGSGLGSMIISSILKNLNIKMTHIIKKKVGTEIILHFPIEITPNHNVSRRTTRPLAGYRVLTPSSHTTSSSATKARVAVIDDESNLANLVAKNIKDKVLIGWPSNAVSKFSKIQKFIEIMFKHLINKNPFNVVLIDQNLGQALTGLELGSLITATYAAFKEEVNIIMISSDYLDGFLDDYRYPWLESDNLVIKTDFTSMNKRLTSILKL